MPNWFRKGLSPHHTALAMVGAKAGDLVVIIGASDVALAAEIARVTALTGQTVVCDPSTDAAARVYAAAADAGVLVEFIASPGTALPFDARSRDVIVVMTTLANMTAPARAAIAAEAIRVLRPGGRLVVIDGARPTGLLAGWRQSSPRTPSGDVLQMLAVAGTTAQRQLAEADGVAFYEARKAG